MLSTWLLDRPRGCELHLLWNFPGYISQASRTWKGFQCWNKLQTQSVARGRRYVYFVVSLLTLLSLWYTCLSAKSAYLRTANRTNNAGSSVQHFLSELLHKNCNTAIHSLEKAPVIPTVFLAIWPKYTQVHCHDLFDGSACPSGELSIGSCWCVGYERYVSDPTFAPQSQPHSSTKCSNAAAAAWEIKNKKEKNYYQWLLLFLLFFPRLKPHTGSKQLCSGGLLSDSSL